MLLKSYIPHSYIIGKVNHAKAHKDKRVGEEYYVL